VTCTKSAQILPYPVEGIVTVQCENTIQGNENLNAAQSRKEEDLLYVVAFPCTSGFAYLLN